MDTVSYTHLDVYKRQPKDTAVEEIDLSAFDMNSIDLPASPPARENTPEPHASLSKKERDIFDDTLSAGEDSTLDEDEPIIKDEFDDDFEDPFDDDAVSYTHLDVYKRQR